MILNQKSLKKFQIEPNTKEINLKGKGIKSVEKLELPNLERLNLSENEIENLDFLKYLTNLKELSLERNKITEIPKSLRKLEKLRKLYIQGNAIESFENLKDLPIKRLKIDVENEEEIKDLLPNLRQLNGKKLDLSENSTLEIENHKVEIETLKGEKSKVKKEPVKGVHVKIEKNRDGYVDFDSSGLLESKKITSTPKKTKKLEVFKNEKVETWE